jgi:hypothetical protein
MHDRLSAHLSRLALADSPDTRNAVKTELLELAKLCQVVPESAYLLESVAGDLMSSVEGIFGAASMIVVLTEAGRRQIYFSLLAHLQTAGRLDALVCDTAQRLELIERMILDSNEDLVRSVYGDCPKGFVRLIARLGDRAYSAAFYVNLYTLLSDVPGLGKELIARSQGKPLGENIVEILMNLPRTPQSVPLAQRFETAERHARFMKVYSILTQSAHLRPEHAERLFKGENPANLLEDLNLAVRFPPPVISAPGLSHIRDGHDLESAAMRFRNCLRGELVEARKGYRQYYVWTRDDGPPVLFSIRDDGPFGWYLDQAKLAENEPLSPPLRQELEELVSQSGIRLQGSFESLIRPFRNEVGKFDMDGFFDFAEA